MIGYLSFSVNNSDSSTLKEIDWNYKVVVAVFEIYAEGVRQFQPGVASTPGKRAVMTWNAESVREQQACQRLQRC